VLLKDSTSTIVMIPVYERKASEFGRRKKEETVLNC